jgi:energy-coupling factor transporter ATP-binding protein EcfA2
MRRQIADIRDRLLTYQVVATRTINSKLNYDSMPSHVDILLFGPAGSGKSSIIKTFYRSLHGA